MITRQVSFEVKICRISLWNSFNELPQILSVNSISQQTADLTNKMETLFFANKVQENISEIKENTG